MFDATVHEKTTQIRACELNMSSILPPSMVPGTAESSPARRRIMMAAVTECASPMIRQQIQLSPALNRYVFLRPNASDQGGKMIVPIDCPRRNLEVVSC